MKPALLCLLFVCLLCTATLANEITNKIQQDSAFGEKLVLCKIDFLPDSYTLSEQAKTVLDDIVIELEKIDTEYKTIRIEGFLGVQDKAAEPARLSMHRALAVENYLRTHQTLSFERFLTGHKDYRSGCRVEISIYDNPWQNDNPPIQLANKDKLIWGERI